LKIHSDDATVVVSNSARGSHFSIVGCADSPARPNERVLMAVRNLTERVEVLEMKVGSLEALPARMSAVESQIVELRTEMRAEFSAVRQEMRALNEETRAEMRALNEETRAEMRTLNEETRTEMRTLNEETRAEMRTLNEETKAQLLTLHEEVLDRISRMGEGRPAGRKRTR
jgi:hypothetical protein